MLYNTPFRFTVVRSGTVGSKKVNSVVMHLCCNRPQLNPEHLSRIEIRRPAFVAVAANRDATTSTEAGLGMALYG